MGLAMSTVQTIQDGKEYKTNFLCAAPLSVSKLILQRSSIKEKIKKIWVCGFKTIIDEGCQWAK